MLYAIPLLLLILAIALFLSLGRHGYRSFGIPQVGLRVLVALPLLVSGIYLHFFKLNVTASIIPPAFAARAFLVVATGVLEIAGAIGLFVPRLRTASALSISILMVAVFPANIYGAGKVIDGMQFPSVPVRLGLQALYIVLVLLAGYGVPRLKVSSKACRE
jgi:uncharacterized membrane protein